jgi:hypothetical protein
LTAADEVVAGEPRDGELEREVQPGRMRHQDIQRTPGSWVIGDVRAR